MRTALHEQMGFRTDGLDATSSELGRRGRVLNHTEHFALRVGHALRDSEVDELASA